MASDHEVQPGNGSDGFSGEQIVSNAIVALAALGGNIVSEQIDAIIAAAIECGGSIIDCGLVAAKLPKPVVAAGISRNRFEARWRELQRQYDGMRREEARKEQAEAKNHGLNDKLGNRTDDEMAQIREELYPRVKSLLDHSSILDAVADAVDTLGAAGVRAESQVLYVSGISALLPQPLSIDVDGPSSIGKSYLVRKVLHLFPDDAKYEFTSASARVFFYEADEDVLKHKIVYAGEATAFYANNNDGDDSGTQFAVTLRQLQSEGKVTHRVTLRNAAGELEAKTITREGPIALILTSTQNLHAENATRNLIVHLKETAQQTRAIIDKRMSMRIDPDAPAAVDLDRWHDLFNYLTYGPTGCIVPYASALGRLIDERHLRIRRDVDAVVSAIEVHTLLNQHKREQDRCGRWIAELADYEAIQPIFEGIMAHGREDVLSDGSRRLHDHVVEQIKAQEATTQQQPGLRQRPRPLSKKGSSLPAGTLTTTQRQLAAKLGSSQPSVFRHLRELYDLQLLKNLETRSRQPLQLRVLAPLPDAMAVSVLPSPDALADAWEKERAGADKSADGEPGSGGSVDQ
jgi:hypothetical protein